MNTIVLLKEQINKMTPNASFHTNRSVPYSVRLREASSCSIWEATQRLITGQCARVRDFEALGSKWDVVIKPLTSGVRISVEEEAERVRGNG